MRDVHGDARLFADRNGFLDGPQQANRVRTFITQM